jgi:hypothetical protein
MASMSVQARFKAQIKWGCKSLMNGAKTTRMPRAAHAVLAAICQCRMRQQWPLGALVARGARAMASAAAARSLAGARDGASSAMTSGPRRARATCAGRCGSRRVPHQRCARTSLAARHAVADMAPTTKACGAVDAHIPSVGCARANAAADERGTCRLRRSPTAAPASPSRCDGPTCACATRGTLHACNAHGRCAAASASPLSHSSSRHHRGGSQG